MGSPDGRSAGSTFLRGTGPGFLFGAAQEAAFLLVYDRVLFDDGPGGGMVGAILAPVFILTFLGFAIVWHAIAGFAIGARLQTSRSFWSALVGAGLGAAAFSLSETRNPDPLGYAIFQGLVFVICAGPAFAFSRPRSVGASPPT